MIAIGGTVYLSLDNRIAGSFLFSIGLYSVCNYGFNLYTGKVCYVWENDWLYGVNTIVIWLGNFVGCYMVSLLLRFTRLSANLMLKAQTIVDIKLSDSLISIFILGMFCNMMIYIGVDGYRNNPHEVGKYLAIVLGIMVFILCGFEHCIANMYYISMAGMWSGKALLFLLINTMGNAVGGWIIPFLRQQGDRHEKKI
ncbi:MAG: formate/nitrite transporter family protein [Clostridia bacterium]|nr:formate/nitrite transporter family protein [Clostridia bacterium]